MDAHQPELGAWDASVCAHPDAADVCPELHWLLQEDGVERLAGQEQDGRAQDARLRSELLAAPAAELHAPAPCTPDVVRSAERSCAAPEAPERLEPSLRGQAAEPTLKLMAVLLPEVFVQSRAPAPLAAE
jgi:hypothetical protein